MAKTTRLTRFTAASIQIVSDARKRAKAYRSWVCLFDPTKSVHQSPIQLQLDTITKRDTRSVSTPASMERTHIQNMDMTRFGSWSLISQTSNNKWISQTSTNKWDTLKAIVNTSTSIPQAKQPDQANPYSISIGSSSIIIVATSNIYLSSVPGE